MDELEELARLYGVELSYDDAGGRRREASPDALLRVLQVLGAPIERVDDVADALRVRREAPWRRGIEPVMLAWDGAPAEAAVRLRSAEAARRVRGTVYLEEGGILSWEWDARQISAVGSSPVGGGSYVEKRLPLPEHLPWGCHRLVLEQEGEARETLVISAPTRAYAPAGPGDREWGVFMPLYALHSESSWGAGDFSDLGRLLGWVRDLGGGVVGTLPLLAAFLEEPFEPSPYSPVSRLFWNEFYLDVAAIPELAGCAAARAILGSTEFGNEVDALRSLPGVDYPRQMALKRRVLEELSRHFFGAADGRREAFERFIAQHPDAEDYARFRAAGERRRSPWTDWAETQRGGTLGAGDYDEDARRYHLYVQWLADEQLNALASRAREAGPVLYLDLPLGVHRHGYDVWRERGSFAVEASGGRPPDLVFPKGQDWGFPPLHPERIRDDGYRYVRAYLEHQVKYAGVLRIDHIPAFHRLYWIPDGMEASDGVYVRYPAEELYALFSLASHRHRTLLVGEDLGTVPPEVPESMARHAVHTMHVTQYAAKPEPGAALPPPPRTSVASLNTHDMPPFAAFLDGSDIQDRAGLGLQGEQDPAAELETRRTLVEAIRRFLHSSEPSLPLADSSALLRACLLQLASSDARLVLVNLEDLWLETRAQNIPSTSSQHPNWQRKAVRNFEQLCDQPRLRELLKAVDQARQDGGPRSDSQ